MYVMGSLLPLNSYRSKPGGYQVYLSQIYGAKREDLLKLLEPDTARKLAVSFIHQFPKSVYIDGLRKLKSRNMHEAMIHGEYAKGNHRIVYKDHVFVFLYRGTAIYLWQMYEDVEQEIVSEYDHTASTKNQRREIKTAIKEFKEAVLKL
jgi:hypothetical protein